MKDVALSIFTCLLQHSKTWHNCCSPIFGLTWREKEATVIHETHVLTHKTITSLQKAISQVKKKKTRKMDLFSFRKYTVDLSFTEVLVPMFVSLFGSEGV